MLSRWYARSANGCARFPSWAASPGSGSVGIRPGRGLAIEPRELAELVEGKGIVGDRYMKSAGGGKRQVTLIQAEHLPVIGSIVGRGVEAHELRRNLAVSGINLLSLVSLRFAIGEAILVGTGPCAPCNKMDEILGEGGFQAMRGHGGITASIERGGTIRLGDVVRVI
jgi:MOSC domain-containing protein YiiM